MSDRTSSGNSDQLQPTVGQVIEQTMRALEQAPVYYGHGTDNPLDEAAWLVSHVTALPPDFSDDVLDMPVSKQQRADIATLLQKRISMHKPLAYLINEAWFAGLKFYVDERVIIPRSPIAELIHEKFTPWVNPEKVNRILDLCTGSACIAIALARAFPEATVDATDISAEALEVAEINLRDHHLADRVNLVQSNLFQDLHGRQYDLIVSNPPYVDAEDMASLPKEFKHEPELALSAGVHGLDLVVPMLAQASNHLTQNGIIVVEVGNSAPALEAMFPQVPFTWLEFESGGHGVFLLEKFQLQENSEVFSTALQTQHAGE